jgi:hypothetical protein
MHQANFAIWLLPQGMDTQLSIALPQRRKTPGLSHPNIP